MNNTDNRVVSLRFDNTGFAQKISQARQGLQKLNDDLKLKGTEEGSSRIESFFDKIKSAVKKTDLEPIDKSVEKTESSFKALEVVAVGALLNIGAKISDLGIKMAKSMSIDQVKAGFDKYEQLLKSTQTILATDENLTQDFVNEQLKKLTWYTDETSYAMTDMVSNISQFTNMGIALEDAVQDMIGIGNAAGMAGASVSQASHAMAGFSKAMATGYMSKQIWSTWIKNSSIGTMEFKKQVIEAALALGTLKKSQDGTLYSANGKVFDVTAENFDETLSKGKWFTTAVMEATLKRYSKAMDQLYEEYYNTGKATSKIIEEMGGDLDAFSVKAFRLAQEATTFTQAVDSLFDAMSSRWSEIITLVFGDYEQAKVLWTDLANWLYDTFMTPVDNLLEKIEAWSNTFIRFTKDVESGVTTIVTARDELIGAFKNLFGFLYSSEDEVKSVMSSIAEAWSDVFGETPLEYLIELTIRFKKWTDKLYNNEQIMDRIKRIATDIFKVLKLVKSIIFAIGNILRKVVWPIVKSILGFVLNVAETIFTIISGIASGISGAIDGIFGSKQKITKIEQITKDTTDAIRESKDAIKDATKALEEAEEEMDDASDSTDKATKKTKKATEATEEYTSALEKAIKEGKTFSDENYIYTKEGLQIPKNVQINPNSIAGQLQKLIQAIKSIGTGTTEVEKNIQNSFKDIGKNVEKTVKKSSNTIKTIAKNGLLYKTFDGIRTITDKTFNALDKSFDRTKNNVINFSKNLKGMFGIFHKNKTKNNTDSILPGISSSSLSLSSAISKTNKKNKDMINGISKDTESLIDVYDKAAKEPDKLEKIGTGVSNAISNTLGYVTTKMLKGALKLVGEDTEIIDKKTASTDAKIKELSSAIGNAIAKGVMSISWSKIKEAFLNILEAIKSAFNIVKSFFFLWKEGENVMMSTSSSSSSSLGKVEKKSKSIWDIFNNIVKKVADFALKLKYTLKTYSIYDKETGELKTGWLYLKLIIDGIKSSLYIALEFIQSMGRGLKKISFSGIIDSLFKIYEWFKNTRIYKWFKTLSDWIWQFKEDVDEFGFKQAFDNLFNHIWVRIKLLAHDIKEAMLNAFDKINTDEWWEKLDSSKAYTTISKVASNLIGIITKAVRFALSEVVDIIFAKVSSFLAVGSTDLSQYFRHAFTEVNGEMVEVSTWDKLKYIFENVFNGALFGNLLYTNAGKFISWFTDTLFSSIGNKVQEIKTTFESIFKRNKKEDGLATSYMTSEIDTKGMSKVASDVKELQLENNEGINWDKILGGTIFIFTIARIVSAWKYFIKYTVGDKGGVGSIASSIKEIGTAFATIATGTVILAVLSFAASLFIFVKAMEALGAIHSDSIENNAKVLMDVLDTLTSFVILILTTNFIFNTIGDIADIAQATGGNFNVNIESNGILGIAALVLSITAGLAALVFALSKLAAIPTDSLKEKMPIIREILYSTLGAIFLIVGIAGVFGMLQAKNAKVPEVINMGKWNMGNVFQTITNKSPALQGISDLVKNLGTTILAFIGSFIAILSILYILEKKVGKDEAIHYINVSEAILASMFLFMAGFMAIMLKGVKDIIWISGDKVNVEKVLGNLAWVMISTGVGLALLFMSIGSVIKKLSSALTTKDTAQNITVFSSSIAIILIVLSFISKLIKEIMDSAIAMAALADGDEQKGKNIQKILKAYGKLIKSVISPFKWLFAGIGLMVKLMKGADPGTLVAAGIIVGVVMSTIMLTLWAVIESIDKLITFLSSNESMMHDDKLLISVMHSMFGMFASILGAIVILFGLFDLIMRRINKDNIQWEDIYKTFAILGVIFLVVAASIGIIIGVLKVVEKSTMNESLVSTVLKSIIIFIAVLAGLIGIVLDGIIWMLYEMKDSSDIDALTSLIYSINLLLLIVAGLLAIFVGFTKIASDSQISGKTAMAYAGSFAIFAVAIGLIAASIIALASFISEDALKPVGILLGIIGGLVLIFAGFTLLASKLNINVLDILGIAAAFVIFSVAIGIIGAAFALMAQIIFEGQDFKETAKKLGLMFGVIAALLLIFAGFTYLMNASGGSIAALDMLGIAASFIVFAAAVVVFAAAIVMIQDALSQLNKGDFVKIVGLLIGFVAILAILGGITVATGGGFAVAMIAVAAAFGLFALAIIGVALAAYIFVAAFERLFNVLLRLPELVPVLRDFLQGLREQVLPELEALLLGIQDMAFNLIRNFFLGVWNLILWGLGYWATHAEEAVNLAVDGIVGIIDGIANGVTRIDAAMTNLFSVIGNTLETHWNNLVSRVRGWFDNIGDNTVLGFIKGIGGGIKDLFNIGEDMGDAVAEGAQDSLQVESPSKLLEWIGKMAVKGLEKGIGNKEEQSGLYKAAGSLKDKLMDALNGDDTEKTGILDGLKDKVQGIIDGQDFTATIKGVLDMDEMMNQMNSLDTESLIGNMDMSSMMNNMDTSALMGNTASAFSDMKLSTDAPALMNQNGTGDVYNVTTMEQNNYSPKSLDAATQYRQTNNLVDNSLRQTGTTAGGHAMYGHRESRRVDSGRVTAGGRPIYVYKK